MSDDTWLGDMLLGHEGRQQRDIRRLRDDAEVAAIVSHSATHQVELLQRRVDRLELACETLLHVVLERGVIDREALAQIMARVDLRDGREDGGLRGDEPAARTPLCPTCELPINPKREACVYCGAAITGETQAAAERHVRMVHCSRCGVQVDERRSVYSGNGLVCDRCEAE